MGTGDEQTLWQREEPTASDERSEYFCTKRFNVSIFTVDTVNFFKQFVNP